MFGHIAATLTWYMLPLGRLETVQDVCKPISGIVAQVRSEIFLNLTMYEAAPGTAFQFAVNEHELILEMASPEGAGRLQLENAAK